MKSPSNAPAAVNRRRGEVPVELDGAGYRLRLTLGALAELESTYAAADLTALVERFGRGRLSADDIIRVIGAGLRGGGQDISDAQVGTMALSGGAAAAARAVAELLTETFGSAPPEVRRTANP